MFTVQLYIWHDVTVGSGWLTWFVGVVGGEDAHAHDGGEADEDGAQPEDVAHALALGHGGSVTG